MVVQDRYSIKRGHGPYRKTMPEEGNEIRITVKKVELIKKEFESIRIIGNYDFLKNLRLGVDGTVERGAANDR